MLFYLSAVALVVLETCLFNHLQFFSVRPNLILFLITIFSFYFNFDRPKVVWFCLFCGLLKDAFSVAPLGTHMFVFVFVGLVLGYLSQRFLRYNWIFIMPLFILATFLQGMAYLLILNTFFRQGLSVFDIPWRLLILEMVYGLAIFVIFFKLIKKCVIDKLS